MVIEIFCVVVFIMFAINIFVHFSSFHRLKLKTMQLLTGKFFRNTNWVCRHFSAHSMPTSFNTISFAANSLLSVGQILKKAKLMNKQSRHPNGRPNGFARRNSPHSILKLNWSMDTIKSTINEQKMAEKYPIKTQRKIPLKWAQAPRSIGCCDKNLRETQHVFGWIFQPGRKLTGSITKRNCTERYLEGAKRD